MDLIISRYKINSPVYMPQCLTVHCMQYKNQLISLPHFAEDYPRYNMRSCYYSNHLSYISRVEVQKYFEFYTIAGIVQVIWYQLSFILGVAAFLSDDVSLVYLKRFGFRLQWFAVWPVGNLSRIASSIITCPFIYIIMYGPGTALDGMWASPTATPTFLTSC